MINAILLAVGTATAAPPVMLQRQTREDTIYVLKGSKAALERFRTEVGNQWTGGTLVTVGSKAGFLRYWAYSDRTAVEARALMMPAVLSGLMKGVVEYSEATAFPQERRRLDGIAVGCGATVDPFFITPNRSVELSLPADASKQSRACLASGQATMAIPMVDARKRNTAQ